MAGEMRVPVVVVKFDSAAVERFASAIQVASASLDAIRTAIDAGAVALDRLLAAAADLAQHHSVAREDDKEARV